MVRRLKWKELIACITVVVWGSVFEALLQGRGEMHLGGEQLNQPKTLTEAASRSGLLIVSLFEEMQSTNSRVVPYRESYRDRTAWTESPAEYLQRAAEDDEKRRAQPDQ